MNKPEEIRYTCANCGSFFEGEGATLRCPGCADKRENYRTLRAELKQVKRECEKAEAVEAQSVKWLPVKLDCPCHHFNDDGDDGCYWECLEEAAKTWLARARLAELRGEGKPCQK